MKTPGALVEASVSDVPRVNVPVCAVNGVRATPSVSVPVCAVTSVVPVCVVSRCVYTSVFKCVLRRTRSTGERRCVRGASSVSATDRVKETLCASGVVTSVPACVLPGTPCVKGAPQAEETTCARKAARVCEPPCVVETPRVSAPMGVSGVVCMNEAQWVSDRPCVGCVRTACVRSLYTREMSVAMNEHAAASPVVSMSVVCSLSLVARGSMGARAAWRRRLRLWRAKCRVAAVVAIGTVPGLHGRARVVRAVPRTRPPRARLRGLRPGPETHAVD